MSAAAQAAAEHAIILRAAHQAHLAVMRAAKSGCPNTYAAAAHADVIASLAAAEVFEKERSAAQ